MLELECVVLSCYHGNILACCSDSFGAAWVKEWAISSTYIAMKPCRHLICIPVCTQPQSAVHCSCLVYCIVAMAVVELLLE